MICTTYFLTFFSELIPPTGYVYIISHGVAHAKKVKTGISSDQNIEIISGLSLGDEVVLSGQINLKEGSITKVINK